MCFKSFLYPTQPSQNYSLPLKILPNTSLFQIVTFSVNLAMASPQWNIVIPIILNKRIPISMGNPRRHKSKLSHLMSSIGCNPWLDKDRSMIRIKFWEVKDTGSWVNVLPSCIPHCSINSFKRHTSIPSKFMAIESQIKHTTIL